MTLEPLAARSPRLSDLVFERMANAILTGTLAPGSVIKDADLARELSVSRMPIREALQRLARIGLVEVAASRFTRVTSVTPDLVPETIDVARFHACAVVELALPRLSARDAQDLAAVIREAIGAVDSGDPPLVATRRVYRRMATFADNRFLAQVHADVEIAIERNLMSVGPGDAVRRHVCETLRELDAAIATGDASAATDAVIRQYRLPGADD